MTHNDTRLQCPLLALLAMGNATFSCHSSSLEQPNDCTELHSRAYSNALVHQSELRPKELWFPLFDIVCQRKLHKGVGSVQLAALAILSSLKFILSAEYVWTMKLKGFAR